ncbi:MAG: FkbM family methyltransferase [Acidobacteriota bacterium]|nr:FkbM family methyltransferase [Acidobacteriota bacterium]
MSLRWHWDYLKFQLRGLPLPDPAFFDFLEPGMLVFDVGANVGNYTRMFLDKESTVIAVEPQTYCCRFLRRRFFGHRRVTIVQCGVGAREEVRELMVSSSHMLSSFNPTWVARVIGTGRFAPNGAVWNVREKVTMTTLDALILKYGRPDYLKIDVEGYEQDVLEGLHHAVRYLSLEFTIPELRDDAIACLRALGGKGRYEFASLLHEGPRKWIQADELEQELYVLGETRKLQNGDILARLVETGGAP